VAIASEVKLKFLFLQSLFRYVLRGLLERRLFGLFEGALILFLVCKCYNASNVTKDCELVERSTTASIILFEVRK
jgi:hypothetical protein